MTLHLLHLAHDPADAELARAALAADGVACAVTRVSTRADFLAALAQGGCDIILADYALPAFDGPAALAIAQEKLPETPFIFLADARGEEVAIESLKRGARDYVVKERLARLAPAVRRALHETEERTARQRTEAQMRLLLSLTQAISGAPDFLSALQVALRQVCEGLGWVFGEAWIPRPDGNALELSPAWYGGARTAALRKLSEGISFPPGVGLPGRAWATKHAEWLRDVSMSAPVFLRAQTALAVGIKSGLAVPIVAGGQALAVLGYFMDEVREEDQRLVEIVSAVAAQLGEVFQRKQAEDALRNSERRFRALIENSHDVTVLFSAGGVNHYISPSLNRVFGYTAEELLGRNAFERVHPDDLPPVINRFDRLMQQPGATETGQVRYRHRDGSWRWIEASATNLLTEPSVGAVVANYRDVTERVRAEQRLAAQYAVARCLAESDTLADAAPKILQAICASLDCEHGEAWSALWRPDTQANVLRCAEIWQPPASSFPEFAALTRQIEFAPGVGLPGRVWASGEPAWIPDVTQDASFARAPIAAKEGLRAGFAFPLKSNGGVLGVMGFFSREIRQPDNDLLQMFTSISNQISQFIERKRAEQALKESEEYFRSLIENASDVITVLDGAGTILYESPSIERVLGYKPEELLGQNAFELVHPEELADTVEAFARGFQSLESTPLVEARFRHKDGSWRVVEMIGKPALGRAKQVIGIVNARDITQRKQAEEETRLLLALTQAINEAPDFDSALRMALQTVCESADWDMGEAWIPRADGSALELSPVWYGQRPGLEKFITDSQSFAFTPGEGLPGRVWASRQSEWLKDVSVDGEIFPRAAIAVQAGIKAALAVPTIAGGQMLVLVFFMREAREEERRLVEIVSAAAAQLGSLFQRKRAEEALREREQQLSSIYDTAADVILQLAVEKDGRYRFASVNQAFLSITGLDYDQVVGKRVDEVIPEPSLTLVLEKYGEAIREKRIVRWEETSEYPTGRLTGEVSVAPVFDDAGNCTHLVGAVHDITERKRAEESLKLFRTLIDRSNDAIEVVDPETLRFLDVNEKACLDLGYSREELLSLQVLDIDPTLDPSSAQRMREQLQKSGFVIYEGRHRRKDGTTFPVEVNIKHVELDRGYVVGIVRDITERKRAEESLQKLSSVVEQTTDNVFITDRDGIIQYVNPAFEQLTGYTREEALGQTPRILKSGTYPPEFYEEFWKTIFVGNVLQGVVINRKKNGELYYDEKTVSPLRDARGNITHFVSTGRDITERVRAEETLRASEERYRTLAEAAQDAIFIIGRDDRVEYVNSFAASQFGSRPEELIGKTRTALFPPHVAEEQSRSLQEIFETGNSIYAEAKTVYPTGEIWIGTRLAPIQNEVGEVRAVLGIARDITERKQAEAKLHATLADLERSNADLQQFAYVASHDLQEPLRMVASYTQLLGIRYQGRLDADADEFIGYAVEGATRMQQLILDLLEYARVGARGLPLQPTDATLACQAAIQDLAVAITENGATVVCDPLPTVLADPPQLRQLFQNLIANAIKFHGAAPPVVHVAARLTSADLRLPISETAPPGADRQSQIENRKSAWEFSVRDNGIGIEPQYFDRIFVIFQRLHSRREYPGTGIGLAICKKIVERHGGRIWAESAPGQGMTFFFALPATE